jgi:hypothetical protein
LSFLNWSEASRGNHGKSIKEKGEGRENDTALLLLLLEINKKMPSRPKVLYKKN